MDHASTGTLGAAVSTRYDSGDAVTCPALQQLLQGAVAQLQNEGVVERREHTFWVQRVPAKMRAQHGDFWSNAALVLAAEGEASTRKSAGELARCIIERIEWSGSVQEANGRINFQLDESAIARGVARAVEEREHYGASDALAGTRVVVEFVSAEPSGPLPFTAARSAAMGDALCRILALQGASVTREYYLNDAESSSRMRLLGESVAAIYLSSFGHESEPPEGAMDDAFVRGVAQGIASREGNAYLLMPESERAALFARKALDAIVTAQKATLRDFGVRFDVWTSEQALRDEGRVTASLQKLRERGHLYERDGAEWLRTTTFGDNADRTVVRTNGKPTYLATDIAYHGFKLERGFDRLINIWSAEHRQYIARTRAALLAGGCDADKVEVIPCENSRWLREGAPVRRGAGGGVFTMDEALRAVGRDTLRFLLVRRGWDDIVDIDAETARRDDETNPAYAARLVPARLSTLIREAEARAGSGTVGTIEYSQWSEAEQSVARLVALWPDVALGAATRRAPQEVAQFVSELAAGVRDIVKTAQPNNDTAINAVRLPLLQAARVVAANALQALGVDAATKL
ncbi:MAG TPA: arginine--tRNA ligase [Abditibacteriaceae bacterium]